MSAVLSSSTRKPIDTTFERAVADGAATLGSILPSLPPRRPSTPSMRGTLKPQMSASSTPTVSPRAASAAARFTVTDDLPTPPLPLATASTRVVDGTSVGAASSRALNRARCIAAVFCSLRHLAVLDLHRADAGEAAHLRLDVLADLHPQRAAGGGERHRRPSTVAVGADHDVVDHAEVDDRGVQLGVDDPGQHAPDVVGRRRGTRDGLVDRSARVVGVRCAHHV